MRKLAFVSLMLFIIIGASGQVKKPVPPKPSIPYSKSMQAIVVTTRDWSATQGTAQLLISSAGYLGTTAFGTMLLVWMRYNFSSRNALYFSSAFVGLMTVLFGLLMPLWNVFALQVSLGSIVFTVFSGAVLTAGLFALARYGTIKWVNFGLAFLAVQCLLNAIFSLVDLFFITATTNGRSSWALHSPPNHSIWSGVTMPRGGSS